MIKAKVTLIRTPSLFAAGALTLSAIPPLGLAYLAGSLREKGWRVKIIDAVAEAITQVRPAGYKNLHVNGLAIDEIVQRIDPDTKYLGVSFPFSHEWPMAKQLVKAIKARWPHLKIFGGGEHMTAMPEFSLRDCSSLDVACLGEGEGTVVALIDAWEKGATLNEVGGISYLDAKGAYQLTSKRERMREIDDIPRPAWDLLPLEIYLSGGYSFGVNIGRTIPLLATRGCPYSCTFCSNPSMWTTLWRARKAANVVDEMQDYVTTYKAQNFDFYDLTAIVRKDWTIEFCQLLKERQLNITWQLPSGTRSEALDDEVTKLLYETGCRNISYAPESGSPEILKRIKKKVDLDRMIISMRAAKRNKINIKCNIIVGFPGERMKNILETYRFILRMSWAGVDDVSVWTFCAYPGSAIFNDLVKAGRITKFDDDYFYSLLSYSDLRNVTSWNEHFNGNQLKFLRLGGLLIFYSTTYLFRPWRLFTSLKNIFTHQPRSRMEMIVEKALFRHRKS